MAVNINADTTTGLELTSDTSGNINIQNDGTTIVAVTSSGAAVTGSLSASNGATITGNLSIDGNLSVTGTVPGAFFSQSVTFSTNTTVTSANTGKVYYTETDNLVLTLPTPPGGTDSLAYGVINQSTTDLIIAAQTGDYIGPYLDSAVLATGQEAIIVSVGDNWKLIGANAGLAINIVQKTSSGTYTPDATVGSFLVCLGGASGGSGANWSASAGGAYGEKFYASPSGTYNITLGAGGAGGSLTSGGNSNFNAELYVNGGSSSSGNVTGSNYSALGGSGGGGEGGGGGGAGRAGIGGNGSSKAAGAVGGGTGGNSSGQGAAATSEAAGVYNLSSLISSFSFQGNNGGSGAYGDEAIVKVGGGNSNISGGGPGRPGNANTAGESARCTIIEFKG